MGFRQSLRLFSVRSNHGILLKSPRRARWDCTCCKRQATCDCRLPKRTGKANPELNSELKYQEYPQGKKSIWWLLLWKQRERKGTAILMSCSMSSSWGWCRRNAIFCYRKGYGGWVGSSLRRQTFKFSSISIPLPLFTPYWYVQESWSSFALSSFFLNEKPRFHYDRELIYFLLFFCQSLPLWQSQLERPAELSGKGLILAVL